MSRRTYDMGTQNAQRVAVKRNTCTEDTYNDRQRVGTSVKSQWPVETCTAAVKWNRMHMHVTMFVSVCINIIRQYATYIYNHASGVCKCTV